VPTEELVRDGSAWIVLGENLEKSFDGFDN